MPGTLDRQLRSTWSRLAAFVAVLALSGSLLAAHGPVAGDHTGAGMGKAMTICLAVMQGAVVVYGTRRSRRDKTRRVAVRYALPWAPPVAQPRHPARIVGSARAGPERLQVFRL